MTLSHTQHDRIIRLNSYSRDRDSSEVISVLQCPAHRERTVGDMEKGDGIFG